MDHDITHCTGEGCKRKETCYRYVAHLDTKNDKHRPYHFYMAPTENCKMYYEYKQLKQEQK